MKDGFQKVTGGREEGGVQNEGGRGKIDKSMEVGHN